MKSRSISAAVRRMCFLRRWLFSLLPLVGAALEDDPCFEEELQDSDEDERLEWLRSELLPFLSLYGWSCMD